MAPMKLNQALILTVTLTLTLLTLLKATIWRYTANICP